VVVDAEALAAEEVAVSVDLVVEALAEVVPGVAGKTVMTQAFEQELHVTLFLSRICKFTFPNKGNQSFYHTELNEKIPKSKVLIIFGASKNHSEKALQLYNTEVYFCK
jgi:hypothetical protein